MKKPRLEKRRKSLNKNLKNHIKTKHRRGRRQNAKSFSKSLRFLGINAAGLRPKLFTFKKVLKDLKPSIFFMQETKLKDAGKYKFNNYILFEKPRKKIKLMEGVKQSAVLKN